ncbi:sugar dehydrogenase [Streptomyces sp. A7024]|uniref:Sugar dehydrogenase n=1 Tax=Streptomyces coryli TaxID=1128680 RepID=A0A6G4TSA5_9ACTN|nr:sugar dehydrogenase [Streptomyces coryli]NGN62662.1 sugar dehydrogenase [Streptomyces coryli]
MRTTPPTLEPYEKGFGFPTSLAFDDRGRLYVAESGLPFGGATPGGGIWRLRDGRRELIAEGLRAPVNGVTVYDGALYVSEGGNPGRILRLPLDGGTPEPVLDQLPGGGNYQTNMTAFGPDGRLYFSQGAATNTGVIGLDALDIGWLKRLPHPLDIPGRDIELRAVAVETDDPREGGDRAVTGPFAPFGSVHPAGTRIPAALPCTAAVMSCAPDGSDLRLVAWGLRNAYGLLFLPDGRLLVTDQGANDRGSRPVGGAPELLYEVRAGAWYGWPDFIGGVPVTDPRYRPEGSPPPEFVLANHHELPPPEAPLLAFAPHSAAVKMTLAPDGSIVVALFGDEIPLTAPSGPRSGRALAVVDPDDWSHTVLPTPALKRPIDVAFGPDGQLYVLDFGHFEPGARGRLAATAGSGGVWRARW